MKAWSTVQQCENVCLLPEDALKRAGALPQPEGPGGGWCKDWPPRGRTLRRAARRRAAGWSSGWRRLKNKLRHGDQVQHTSLRFDPNQRHQARIRSACVGPRRAPFSSSPASNSPFVPLLVWGRFSANPPNKRLQYPPIPRGYTLISQYLPGRAVI